MALTLEPLELATLLPGAREFKEENKSEVWKAQLQAESGQKIAFLKMLPRNQLVSEITCALIGRALGLNIPKPFLVSVRRTVLPLSKMWADSKKPPKYSEWSRLAFALEDGTHPSLRKWFNDQWGKDNAKLMATVSKWSASREAAVFDEWIANIDRNIGNMLFDGIGNVVLIDHGHAFTGPKWTPFDLRDSAVSARNKLIADLGTPLTASQRWDWKNAANSEAIRYKQIDFSSLANDCLMERYAEGKEPVSVCEFLKARVDKVSSLVAQKLGIGTLIP